MANFFNTICLCNSYLLTRVTRTIHSKQNYYDVLHLNKNCTNRDIKRAYYELSKKYHPDRNSSCSPKLFLAVSEAYKILGKPESRYRYDMSLQPQDLRYRADYHEQFMRRNRADGPVFYRARRYPKPSYEYEYMPPPFHEMRNARRIPSSVILSAVLLFMSVGLILQAVAFRDMMRLRQEEALMQRAIKAKRTKESNQSLPTAAEDNCNHEQMKLLEQRFRENNIPID